MAAMFGKMLEVRDGNFGDSFNPVWAAEVEVNTRLEVADFVLRNKIDPIHIAVDGVVSPVPVELTGEGIGSWKLSNVSPCICVGTGLAALRDNGVGEFHLKYDWLKEQIENKPDANEYELRKLNPVTLNEAANREGMSAKIGELNVLAKSINLTQAEKRAYKERAKNGGELLTGKYSSVPWDVSIVGKE